MEYDQLPARFPSSSDESIYIRLRFPLLVITCVLFAASPLAQARSSALELQEIGGPVQHYDLDFATGVLVKTVNGTSAQPRTEPASAFSYENNCTSGLYAAVPLDQEFIDYGVKSASLSEIVNSFTFAYATDTLDISIGGTGAALDIALFEGSMGGVLGAEVARFCLTGLPGTSMPGNIGAFAITIDLSGGFEFCLADGPIGYGYCQRDGEMTGPILIEIDDCPNGTVNFYDEYASCPATGASFVGSFSIGTPAITSFFMIINEDDGTTAATSALNLGANINVLDFLTDGGTPPTLGDTWPLTHIDIFGAHTLSGAVWAAGGLPPGTLLVTNGLGTFEVIIDPTSAVLLTQTVSGSLSFDQSILVPKNTGLIGLTATVQAIGFGGGSPYSLSNGVDVTVGF